MSNSLSRLQQITLFLLSFFIVALGQPTSNALLSLITALLGYALFWRILLDITKTSKRFWLSFSWFFCIQLVQLHWFVSHPYLYIWSLYLFLCTSIGAQFGIIGCLITEKRLQSTRKLLIIPALWAILEWSRLHLLSGFSWNPVGLALASNVYSLQTAALWGSFGLSFWVFLTNIMALRAWIMPKQHLKYALCWLIIAFLPYLYGIIHIATLDSPSKSESKALLVQTAFGSEELENSNDKRNIVEQAIDEWSQILLLVNKHESHALELVVLPEFVVPFSTYTYAYPLTHVLQAFADSFGPENLSLLPPLEAPYLVSQKTPQGVQFMVNNAFWAQGIANYLNTHLLIGMEDIEYNEEQEPTYYSAALLFRPQHSPSSPQFFHPPERYEKRVLVPMGEYIPFEWCRSLAARYGICASFTCGTKAHVMSVNDLKISPSICYEETFGNIIREGRVNGANLFVNLTNDAWYPHSSLPLQHLEHARLRTVENGIPLLRACNTGVTAAIDSFGRNCAVLGDDHPQEMEWVADSLLVDIPSTTYSTIYSIAGDSLPIFLCILLILIGLL